MLRPTQILTEISKAYPNVWQQVKYIRGGKGKEQPNWADWCYLPIGAGIAIATNNDDSRRPEAIMNPISPCIIVAGATWRLTKGVYRFDPELYNILIKQPMTGNIPSDALKRLPEWCVYVEMQDSEIEGFWAHLEHDLSDDTAELRFVIMFKNGANTCLPIKLGNWTLKEWLDKMTLDTQKFIGEELPKNPDKYVNIVAGMLQLVLYLCADNIDIPSLPQHPSKRVRRSGQVDVAREVRTWDVGQRIGATIRKYENKRITEEDEQLEQKELQVRESPRPHIRAAHWHSYWTGPRDGERKLILKWLPPIPVNVTEDEDNPVVIRRVK